MEGTPETAVPHRLIILKVFKDKKLYYGFRQRLVHMINTILGDFKDLAASKRASPLFKMRLLHARAITMIDSGPIKYPIQIFWNYNLRMPQQKSAKIGNISSAMASQKELTLHVFPIKAEKEADLVMEVSSSKY